MDTAEHLQSLIQALATLRSEGDLPRALVQIHDQAQESLPVCAAGIWVPDGLDFRLVTVYGLGASALPEAVLASQEDGTFGWCLQTARPVVRNHQGATLVLLAVSTSTSLVGVLALLVDGPAVSDDLTDLIPAASLLAMAMENLRLTGQLEAEKQWLEVRVAERTAEAVASREAAERLLSEKRRFFAAMSHDMRGPLTGILGIADLLTLDPQMPEEARDLISTLRLCADTQLDLVANILDLSRIDAGSVKVTPVPFDLVALAHEVMGMLNPHARARGLRLTLHCPPGPLLGIGDRALINRILLNLVGNGLKYTERGGVTVEIRHTHDVATIQVIDTGVGISHEAQARLFTDFDRGDVSTAQRFTGTGLGLSICRQLLTLLGGSITVDSTPGQGSTFTAVLPLPVIEQSHEQRSRSTSGPLPTLKKRGRVLVVDDDPILRLVLRRLLDHLHLNFDLAANGSEARAFAMIHPYALVLTDTHLGDETGLDLVAALRLLNPQLPAVIVSGDATDEARDAARIAGIDDYLVKPVTMRNLALTLDRWLPI